MGTRRGALSAKRSKESVLAEKILLRSPSLVIVSSTRSMCNFGLTTDTGLRNCFPAYPAIAREPLLCDLSP